jgi:hypothetical protein
MSAEKELAIFFSHCCSFLLQKIAVDQKRLNRLSVRFTIRN